MVTRSARARRARVDVLGSCLLLRIRLTVIGSTPAEAASSAWGIFRASSSCRMLAARLAATSRLVMVDIAVAYPLYFGKSTAKSWNHLMGGYDETTNISVGSRDW